MNRLTKKGVRVSEYWAAATTRLSGTEGGATDDHRCRRSTPSGPPCFALIAAHPRQPRRQALSPPIDGRATIVYLCALLVNTERAPYATPVMDTLTPAQRSRRMASVRSKDTKPELLVRRLVHSLGYRYRLHGKLLPGRPDMVFAGRHTVIFVHGCFWHRHAGCPKATMPKANANFWRAKFRANRKRDRRIESELASAGWDVVVVWECETTQPTILKRRLIRELERNAR